MPFISSSLTATGLGTWLVKRGADTVVKGILPDKLNTSFKKCLSKASKELESIYPGVLGGNIYLYLQDERIVNELYKMLFIESKIDVSKLEEYIDFSTLPDNFYLNLIASIKKHALKDENINIILSNNLIYEIVNEIHLSIDQILENSNNIKDDITYIKGKLNESFKARFSYDSFLNDYLNSLQNSIEDVNFFGLGIEQTYKKPRIKLEEIFVKPTLISSTTNEKHNEILIDTGFHKSPEGYFIVDTDRFLEIPKHIVILGNPGAGKSLLVKTIIQSIIAKQGNLISCKSLSNYIPIRVELRNYLFYKKSQNKNILNYLIYMFENEYGVDYITKEDLKLILDNENIIILFDGLDEIFDINEKINIKNDIVNFTKIHKNKSIVTSRFVGYEDAKLGPDYIELEIQDFNDNQILEYTIKWYTIEEQDLNKRNIEINDFIKVKDQLSKELVRNPLLLSLIVILYRNNLRIPESKLEIYQSCTKTLVDKWDSIKKLEFSVNAEILNRKEAILADLAFWQYGILSDTPDKLTYSGALNTIIDSVGNRLKITEWDVTRNIAETFLDYAQKRSIYFDNNFTHKTFLEYFTAFWIYSNCDKKHLIDKRDNILDKYISNPFWTIVFELLLNMIDNDQSDDDIIDGIYQRQIERGWQTYEFLLTSLPSMRNISASQIKSLFNAVFFEIINPSDMRDDSNIRKSKTSAGRLFETLFSLTIDENYFKLFTHNVAKLYMEHPSEQLQIFSIAYEATFARHQSSILNHFIEIDPNFIDKIKSDEFLSTTNFFRTNNLSLFIGDLVEHIKRYGKDVFFTEVYPKYASWRYVAPVNYFIGLIFSRNELFNFNRYLNILESVEISREDIKSYLNEEDTYLILDDSAVIDLVAMIENETSLPNIKVLESIALHMVKRSVNTLSRIDLVLNAVKSEDIRSKILSLRHELVENIDNAPNGPNFFKKDND